MVAGGGNEWSNSFGGDGLIGGTCYGSGGVWATATDNGQWAQGGFQTQRGTFVNILGGNGGWSSFFGCDGYPLCLEFWDFGGMGAGGYYGGASRGFAYSEGGSSSFISGYPGCETIDERSNSSMIIHTGQPVHYSGIEFENPNMIAGNASMPNPVDTTKTRVGNNDNGFITIARLPRTILFSDFECLTCSSSDSLSDLLLVAPAFLLIDEE